MNKLTMEQRETLADIVASGQWDAVMALCDISISHHENRVTTSDLAKGDREIVLAKARLEGAKDMHSFLSRVREHAHGSKKSKLNGD